MARAAQEQQTEFVPVTFLSEGAAVHGHFNEIENRIARRAYELFAHRGRQHGHDLDDWLQAEAEILRPVPVTLHEGEHLYSITAEVPGFQADELNVEIEPRRVFITGRKEYLDQPFSGRPEDIFKVIELSNEVEPHTVVAELAEGVLTISMRKILARERAVVDGADSNGRRSRSSQLHKRADIAKRYADAARQQLERAIARQAKARAKATAGQKGADARAKRKFAPSLHSQTAWTDEAPRSALG